MATTEQQQRSHGVVHVNGVALYWEQRGLGEPIVCIHGTGSSAAAWAEAVDALATRGRTIAYDRRGCHRSERPDPYATNVRQQAEDAAALIDALDAAPAIVIGRSYGGEIALELALRFPDRVRALVLLEGGGFSLSRKAMEWMAAVRERVLVAAEADVGTVAETLHRTVLGDAVWDAWPEQAKQMFAANGPAIVEEFRGGVLDVDTERLATIVQPTLIVGARDSGAELAEATNLLAQAMPEARVQWIEGGHLVDPTHTAVLGFIDELLVPMRGRQRV